MPRKAAVRYDQSKHDKELRYIHKYYLPQDLKHRVFPADIEGIVICLRFEAVTDLPRGVPFENCPDCLISYADIGLEKLIEGQTARRVFLAWNAYHEDCRAELTPSESRAALNLNAWLIEWERKLLTQCVRLSEEMEHRVRSGDDWLTDYEMDLEVSFYVRDADPFSEENMADGGGDDIDRDAALLCKIESLPLRLPIPKDIAAKSDYRGMGDSHDYNDFRGLRNVEIYSIRHCATFHILYDHLQIPMKHMGRIGRINTALIVFHQSGLEINLAGEVAKATVDESRIRQEFILESDNGLL